jgi:hypothetical protein
VVSVVRVMRVVRVPLGMCSRVSCVSTWGEGGEWVMGRVGRQASVSV